jgi:hypothetical protein
LLRDNFLLSGESGPVTLPLAGVAIVLLLPRRKGLAWEWALLVALAVQVYVWMFHTHQMPARFLAPAAVMVAILAAWALDALAASAARWGPILAGIVAAGVSLVALGGAYARYAEFTTYANSVTGAREQLPAAYGVSPRDVGEFSFDTRLAYGLPPRSRVLLVGDAKAFYFPAPTVYSTVFDADQSPLVRLIDQRLPPGEVLRRLRELGITHIWVDWSEVWRLATTYGYPAAISAELFDRRRDGRPAGLDVLDEMVPLGLRRLGEPTSGPATAPAGDAWPRITIYALPPRE